MKPGDTIRLTFPTRLRFPDLGTRHGTVEAIDAGWVVARWGRMVVRLPVGEVVPVWEITE